MVLKDSFWAKADGMPVRGLAPLKHIVDKERRKIVSLYHTIHIRPSLKTTMGRDSDKPLVGSQMRLERKEAAWSDLIFESKARRHQSYADWVTKVLKKPSVAENMVKAGIKKAQDCSKYVSVIKNHNDLYY